MNHPRVGHAVPFGSDPLDALVIPDGTQAEERDIVTAGDAVIGGKSTIEFGVRARSVLAGERVRFGGGLEAENDCRLDTWCAVDGNVLVGEDAYLGERVHVAGQLLVNGDLDVGDDATIEEGFEANGFIHIRNPLPLYLFLVIYLTHLLRRGALEEASTFLEAMDAEEDPGEDPGTDDPDPLLIPRKSQVSDDRWEVSTPARIGDECRLHGNIRAESIVVGANTACYGSLRSSGDVEVGEATVIHGDITAPDGLVTVAAGAVIKGDVNCRVLDVHTDADVEGRIITSEEVRIRSPIDSTETGQGSRSDADETPQTDEAHSSGPDTEDEPPAEPAADPVPMAEAESDATTGIDDPDDDATPDEPAETAALPIIDAEDGSEASDDSAGETPDEVPGEPGLAPTASIIASVEAEQITGPSEAGDDGMDAPSDSDEPAIEDDETD